MKEINLKAQAIVDKYSERLATYGVTLSISRKYLETSVFERSSGRASMLNAIERARDRKTEKENGVVSTRQLPCLKALGFTYILAI